MNAIRRTRGNRGFTLVEILIVVIILGILAAIVIPQFTNASQDARRSSLTSTLQTLRSQIELFKLQHGDRLPNLVGAAPACWVEFTQPSTFGGDDFGPYMQAGPVNPLNGLSNVDDGDGTGAVTDAGFAYDYDGGDGTGAIFGTNEDGDTIFNENP